MRAPLIHAILLLASCAPPVAEFPATRHSCGPRWPEPNEIALGDSALEYFGLDEEDLLGASLASDFQLSWEESDSLAAGVTVSANGDPRGLMAFFGAPAECPDGALLYYELTASFDSPYGTPHRSRILVIEAPGVDRHVEYVVEWQPDEIRVDVSEALEAEAGPAWWRTDRIELALLPKVSSARFSALGQYDRTRAYGATYINISGELH